MTTKELIQYLKACYDAEEGIYELKQLSSALYDQTQELQKTNYSQLTLPGATPEPAPEMPELEEDPREKALAWINQCKKESEFTLDEYIKNLQAYQRAHPSLPPISVYNNGLSNWLAFHKGHKDSIKSSKKFLKNAQALYPQVEEKARAVIARNEEKMREYEEKLRAHEEREAEYKRQTEEYRRDAQEKNNLLISKINDQRTEIASRQTALRSSLDQLYAYDILPERFRNAAAAYQLAEYLEMGVADQLTGTDGAFRVYLEDVRVGRIVGSIDTMRYEVTTRLDTISAQLGGIEDQLWRVNYNLKQLRGELSSQLHQMSVSLNNNLSALHNSVAYYGDQISSAVRDSDRAQRDLMNQLNSGVNNMREIVEKSAYNQYIEQRVRNVDNTLAYMLKNPSL